MLLAPAGGACQSCASTRRWTADPYERLVEKLPEIKARVVLEQGRATEKPDRGRLLEYGKWLEELTLLHDFSFFEELPKAGTQVVVVRALCNLYEKSLADGCATPTGAFIEAFGRHLGIHLVLSNLGMVCWRKKDKNGVLEPTGGQAGCVDPSGKRLEALAAVKQLHFLGLRAAGLDIIGILASSNASIESIDGLVTKNHFVLQQSKGMYKDTPTYTTPHPKYVRPGCVFTASVALTLGVPLNDALAVTSAVLEGFARIAAALMSHASKDKPLEGEPLEQAASCVYEALSTDPTSGAIVRPWPQRRSTTTSPELHAQLVAALAEQSRRGGEPATAQQPTHHKRTAAPYRTPRPAPARARTRPRALHAAHAAPGPDLHAPCTPLARRRLLLCSCAPPTTTAATVDALRRRDYHDASGTLLAIHYLKPEDEGEWAAVPPGADHPKGTKEGKPTSFGGAPPPPPYLVVAAATAQQPTHH